MDNLPHGTPAEEFGVILKCRKNGVLKLKSPVVRRFIGTEGDLHTGLGFAFRIGVPSD